MVVISQKYNDIKISEVDVGRGIEIMDGHILQTRFGMTKWQVEYYHIWESIIGAINGNTAISPKNIQQCETKKSSQSKELYVFKNKKGTSIPRIIALQTNQSTFPLFGHIVKKAKMLLSKSILNA